MENTLENKAKVFALYFGQDVRVWEEMSKSLCVVGYPALRLESVKESHLQLKPISSISDEDAIECCRYKSELSFFTKKKWYVIRHDDFLEVKSKGSAHSFAIDFVSGDVDFYNDQELGVTDSDTTKDFLRSKGYALPAFGLSVEELVKRGWYVLKSA